MATGKTRTIDGYTFHYEKTVPTKSAAKKAASDLRKRHNFIKGVRIIKIAGGYDIW